MTVTVETSGSQAAVLGTEHTLHTNSGAKVFVLMVDTSSMQLADTVILRLYVMPLTGGTARVAYTSVFTHAQPDEPVKISIPLPSPGWTSAFKATLQQTEGTARSYDFAILSV